MAGGKETTRQKLINIMYLVLIAMLALNVSDSVLNAFKNLRDSLTDSKNNVQSGVDQLYDRFEHGKLKDEPARAKPIWDKAQLVKHYADDLSTYIENIKQDFTTEGEGIDPETGDVTKRSDMDIATREMINKGKGAELKQKINETREKLIALLDDKDKANITFSLKAADPVVEQGSSKPRTWEAENFGDGTPLTAAMTILTKIQADTRNAEAEVSKKLFGKMDEAVVTLDQFSAVAVAPSSYVIQGQPYTAEVFLTAYDSKSNPQIAVDGSSLHVEAGKGKYSVTAGEGTHTWKGSVTVIGTDGKPKTYYTEPQTYTVARPSAVVSLDKMNVMYIGVPNPVSVSAPGLAKESVKATMEGGSLSLTSAGHYVATVNTIGTAKVNVIGEISKGVSKVLGSTEYRVKRIPDPVAVFAGKSGGSTSAAQIKASDRVFAKLDNFEYEAKFNVLHFTLLIIKPRQDPIIKTGTNNVLTPDMQNALNSVTPGTIVFFNNIIVMGPDNLKRDIPSITLTVN